MCGKNIVYNVFNVPAEDMQINKSFESATE